MNRSVLNSLLLDRVFYMVRRSWKKGAKMVRRVLRRWRSLLVCVLKGCITYLKDGMYRGNKLYRIKDSTQLE